MAPLQSTFILVEGGENSDPRRMPLTSALYELGVPGNRQTTMRQSGRTAQAPEVGGEPIRLPSVYVQFWGGAWATEDVRGESATRDYRRGAF